MRLEKIGFKNTEISSKNTEISLKNTERGLKNMGRRKKILIPLIAILLSLVGGFFYYWYFYETPPEKWDEAAYSPPEDYEVIETNEGVMVVNEKAGLSFKVPEGWRVEKEKYEDIVALFSPGAEESSFQVKGGCKIGAEVRYIKTSFKIIEEVLKRAHKNWGYKDEYEVVRVSGFEALKNVTGIESLGQSYTGIHISMRRVFESRIYTIGVSCNLQDEDRCFQEFEEFLKAVFIE